MDQFEARMRADFPHLGQRTYLNNAAASLSPPGQGAAAASFYDQAKALGMNGRPQWQGRAQQVKDKLADWLGVAPERLTMLSTTTEALNLVAASLIVRPGDEIVMAADEFPSVRLCWHSAETRGAKLAPVTIPNEVERTDALIAALMPTSRALAVSHINYATGTRVDLAKLSAACRANGTLLVVDGIQALGAVPLDLTGVDVYCGALFKWMLGGFGTTVLMVAESAMDRLGPAYRGYGNIEGGFQYASINYPGLYAAGAAIDYLDGIGRTAIHERVAMLAERLAQGVEQCGYRVLTPASRGGIVCFKVPDAEALVADMAEKGIDVAARAGQLRVSPHFYNAVADVDRFVEALPRA